MKLSNVATSLLASIIMAPTFAEETTATVSLRIIGGSPLSHCSAAETESIETALKAVPTLQTLPCHKDDDSSNILCLSANEAPAATSRISHIEYCDKACEGMHSLECQALYPACTKLTATETSRNLRWSPFYYCETMCSFYVHCRCGAGVPYCADWDTRYCKYYNQRSLEEEELLHNVNGFLESCDQHKKTVSHILADQAVSETCQRSLESVSVACFEG